MISFYFKTCGFTNNANFIHFKWTLKRKHSSTKCAIHTTEVFQMEIRRYLSYSPDKFSECSHENSFVFSKVFGVLMFHYFILNWYILVHILVKTLPKQIYFSFSILKWQIIVQMRKPLSKFFSQVPYRKAKQKQKAKCKKSFAELKNI